ncbi:Protein TPX2 [Bienertia sinuspersici]
MDAKMEVTEDKVCVFEESLEIDFDYEFDVAKYYDFTHLETPEEIAESERWFDLAAGHPPSPLITKLNAEVDDLADSVTSSSRCGSGYVYSNDNGSEESVVSSTDEGKKGPQMLRSKSMSTSQSNLLVSSRLLKPTASLLAKQNQHTGVHSKGASRRFQKPRSSVKSTSEADATKRQKLEIGYLRKVAQLKHQTSFSHKSSKEVGTTDVNSCHAKPKVTVPKEPDLATAYRAQRQRLLTCY